MHMHQTDSTCMLPMHMHQGRLTFAKPPLIPDASLADSAAKASTATALGSRCCKPNVQAAAKASFLSLEVKLLCPRIADMFWLAAEEPPNNGARYAELNSSEPIIEALPANGLQPQFS